jgi:hypothetical protein
MSTASRQTPPAATAPAVSTSDIKATASAMGQLRQNLDTLSDEVSTGETRTAIKSNLINIVYITMVFFVIMFFLRLIANFLLGAAACIIIMYLLLIPKEKIVSRLTEFFSSRQDVMYSRIRKMISQVSDTMGTLDTSEKPVKEKYHPSEPSFVLKPKESCSCSRATRENMVREKSDFPRATHETMVRENSDFPPPSSRPPCTDMRRCGKGYHGNRDPADIYPDMVGTYPRSYVEPLSIPRAHASYAPLQSCM